MEKNGTDVVYITIHTSSFGFVEKNGNDVVNITIHTSISTPRSTLAQQVDNFC